MAIFILTCSRCVTIVSMMITLGRTYTTGLVIMQRLKHRNPTLFASQNLYSQYQDTFYLYLSRKYASFRHSTCCCNHHGRQSLLIAKCGMSTQDVVDFHFVATQIFTQCFDLLYKCLLNRTYRIIYTFLLLCGFCLEMFKLVKFVVNFTKLKRFCYKKYTCEIGKPNSSGRKVMTKIVS